QHAGAVEGHPRGAVGLLEMAAVREALVAVDDADVVEAEKAAGENAVAVLVLAVYPPGEVEEEFLKDAGEKFAVLYAGAFGVDLINAPRGPGVAGRID